MEKNLEETPQYTLSDLKWTRDALFLPGRSGSIPLHYLAYNMVVPENQTEMNRAFDKLCTIYHVRTGQTLIEAAVTHDEALLFSDFQSVVLQSKLDRQ